MAVAAVLLAGMAGTTARAATPKAALPLRVELWGDSLSAQSSAYFAYLLAVTGKVTAREHVFGGTALCDWIPDITREIDPRNKSGFHPQVAVLQFFGNSYTGCMRAKDRTALSGQALVDKYAADAAAVIAQFAKVKITVYFVGAPLSATQSRLYTNLSPLGQMFSRLPARFPASHAVRFSDAATPLEWHGKFSATLPCLSWERCTGRRPDGTRTVVVRQSDGEHFCPVAETAVRGVLPTCPVPAPGAIRFAIAVVGPLAHDFRL
jgi:hypothetical protein